MSENFEEGDCCPRQGCDGNLVVKLNGECFCHIAPPCSACVEARLQCDVCGEEPSYV